MEKLGIQTCVSIGYLSLHMLLAGLTSLYSMFVKEALILCIVALLLVAYYLGKSMNQRRAKAWYVFCFCHSLFPGYPLSVLAQVEDLP